MSSSGRPAILVFLQQTPSALICERIFEGFREEKGQYRVKAFVGEHDGLVLGVNGEISDFRQDILSDCPPRGYVPSSSGAPDANKALCFIRTLKVVRIFEGFPGRIELTSTRDDCRVRFNLNSPSAGSIFVENRLLHAGAGHGNRFFSDLAPSRRYTRPRTTAEAPAEFPPDRLP